MRMDPVRFERFAEDVSPSNRAMVNENPSIYLGVVKAGSRTPVAIQFSYNRKWIILRPDGTWEIEEPENG